MQELDSQSRLKGLFRELFQLDVADLDFGLYRLFRLKRADIEAFLDKQLPAEIHRAFEAAAGSEREALQKWMDELAERARTSVADDAILPSGAPNPAHAAAKAVKEYVEARKRLQAVETSEAQRAEVFNLLYAFFSRYYDDGDFVPRRFFGARASYAAPYNGEEVFFHWANKDQHYVKSGESFRDYAFTVPTVSGEYRVRFRLVEATVPKDNTKGDTRFFFPLPKEATFDKATCTFTVPLHYRLPTEAEVTKYGKNAKGQEAILDEVAPKILNAVPDKFLQASLAAPSPTGREAEDEEPPTLLRRRLSHFTKKNTTDYFVHKNLGAFLRQELEFFIRDQVVHEADLEGDFEAKRQMLRVFRKLAGTVITFLAQIEDTQKRLFEKKKFVLRTDYLVPIQHVPRALWPDVLANKAQLAEWKELFALEPKSDLFDLKGQVNERVLERHPTLVVDTRHFQPDFILRLLEALPDLDEQTDGVLIHGENYQALSLMQVRYREQVKCIYIDPPFNSPSTEILYKNNYKHSSWLSLLADRIALTDGMLIEGAYIVAIDENEQERLGLLLADTWLRAYEKVCVSIRHNPRGIQGKNFSHCHEYAYFMFPSDEKKYIGERRLEEPDVRNLRDSGLESDRSDARNCFYPIIVRNGSIVAIGDVPSEGFHPKGVNERNPDGTISIWPIDTSGQEKKWRYARQSVEEILPKLKVRETRGKNEIYFAKDTGTVRTLWTEAQFDASEYGTKLLQHLFGTKDLDFSYPKSLYTLTETLQVTSTPKGEQFILDYFAGSGTTAHAAIHLNREDGGRRKFILVEMGEYFDTVLVPRIKKVMFTPEWKDGKPKRLPTKEEAERTPRLVKVLRLESYEDALHNTFSDKAIERLAEREKAHREAVGEEEYRIRYLLKLPLDASDSMLNLAKLEHPFEYTLEVLTDHGPKTESVDLVETFNWLYGLRVHRLLTWVNKKDKAGKEKDGRLYRVVVGSDREGKKRILVVWRDMAGLDAAVERPFLEAQAKDFGLFEEQWINGDTAAQGFASLDGLFKRLMEEGER
jgi:adenine-specific DNA-methyltransferase